MFANTAGFGVPAIDLEILHAHSRDPSGRRPKLGPLVPVIDAILEADETAPSKQRHTAKRIFERLLLTRAMAPVSRPADASLTETSQTGCGLRIRLDFCRKGRIAMCVAGGAARPPAH
jgi:hypothetical protein